MTATIGFALAQLNLTVGDLAGNRRKIRDAATVAEGQQADLLITPESAICGYPAEDLLLRPAFIDGCMAAVRALAADTVTLKTSILVGTPWRWRGKVYNAAILMGEGALKSATFKRQLPNSGVFDEKRVFTAGGWPKPLPFRGMKLGVQLCEDLWSAGVSAVLDERGADLLIALNASPFEQGKHAQRLNIAAARSRETHLPVLYVNMVGGQDELVFDGRSFALHPNGQPALQMPAWQEGVQVIRWRGSGDAVG